MVRIVGLNRGGDTLSAIRLHLVRPRLQWDQADRECGIEWTHLPGVALPIVQSTDCDSSEKKY